MYAAGHTGLGLVLSTRTMFCLLKKMKESEGASSPEREPTLLPADTLCRPQPGAGLLAAWSPHPGLAR